jgi:hypothetical protein
VTARGVRVRQFLPGFFLRPPFTGYDETLFPPALHHESRDRPAAIGAIGPTFGADINRKKRLFAIAGSAGDKGCILDECRKLWHAKCPPQCEYRSSQGRRPRRFRSATRYGFDYVEHRFD